MIVILTRPLFRLLNKSPLLRRSLFLLLVMLPLYCVSQDRKPNRDISEIHSRQDALDIYCYAIELEERDSLLMACYAYIRVYYFDSTADIAKKAETKLTVLSKQCKEQFAEKLIGSWQWKWTGSNWGKDNEPDICKCEKSLVIDKDKLYFLTDNTIDSSHEYSLQADNYGRWPLFYYINVPGLNEKWGFHFIRKSWPVVLKDPLTIKREHNCICGCTNDIYERIIFK